MFSDILYCDDVDTLTSHSEINASLDEMTVFL